MTVRVRELTRTDAQIEREIREDVLERTMWIDTGNVDRDNHIRSADFFDVDRYPELGGIVTTSGLPL